MLALIGMLRDDGRATHWETTFCTTLAFFSLKTAFVSPPCCYGLVSEWTRVAGD